MKADEPTAHVKLEALDPARHDRAGFSCGVAPLDNYFHRTARKQQAGDQMRVWVAVPHAAATAPLPVLGYYAIGAHSIEATGLPADLSRGAGRHGLVPAAFLSMIAVAEKEQGRGLGRTLLVDAITRVARAADEVGIAAIILDVIEEGGAKATVARTRFYERMGFTALPSQPQRMVLGMRQARAIKDAVDKG